MAEEQKVAPKLLASQKDLELISDGVSNKLLTFKGWRLEIFGKFMCIRIILYFSPYSFR